MQRFMGIVSLVSAAALAFAAVVYQAPWWSRVIVFAPLWLAGVALLPLHKQGRAVWMAAGLTLALVAAG